MRAILDLDLVVACATTPGPGPPLSLSLSPPSASVSVSRFKLHGSWSAPTMTPAEQLARVKEALGCIIIGLILSSMFVLSLADEYGRTVEADVS